MDSYEIGKIFGQMIVWIVIILFFYGVYRLWKSIFNIKSLNPAQKIIKQYLYWTDFLDETFQSIDDLKKKLKTIQNKIVYKDEVNKIYLLKEEAIALNTNVEAISIKEVLKSEIYLSFLIERLNSITLYEKEDLKSIPKNSELVWFYSSGILMHFVLKDGKYIYPNAYDKNNPYRYGYIVISNQKGLKSVYDINNDKVKLDFIYKKIDIFGNLAVATSNTLADKLLINLDTKQTLETSKDLTIDIIKDKYLDKVDFSVVDLEDYIPLFPTAKSETDLMKMKLWGASVAVVELPSAYASIIKGQTGTIEWFYPNSAGMFDMSIELPVNFEKKNGDYVTIGIKHENIILENRAILNDVKIDYNNKG